MVAVVAGFCACEPSDSSTTKKGHSVFPVVDKVEVQVLVQKPAAAFVSFQVQENLSTALTSSSVSFDGKASGPQLVKTVLSSGCT